MARRTYIRHGLTKAPEYRLWIEMRQRCENPTSKRYADWGGRGIRVCPAWRDFSRFIADMGPRPAGTSIDRIDNDGPYSPENCRWATVAEQNANKRPRRLREVCARGHAMTEENTYARAGGVRRCRECRRIWDREQYWLRKAAA